MSEVYQEDRDIRWLERIWHDLRYSVRSLLRNWGSVALALLALAPGAVACLLPGLRATKADPLDAVHHE
jgi:hypothetical protein